MTTPDLAIRDLQRYVAVLHGALRALWSFSLYVMRRFDQNAGFRSAAALTYSALLSLVPLMAIGFAVFAAFPAFSDIRAEVQDFAFANFVPEVGGAIKDHILNFLHNTGQLTAPSVVALAVTAVLLLATIEATFNTIWRVERQRPWPVRLLVAWSLLTMGPLLIGASLSLSSRALLIAASHGFGDVVEPSVVSRFLPLLLEVVAFTLVYVVVPVRPVKWRHGIVGGVLTAVTFELLKYGFGLYILNFPTYQAIYGALATIPIFLVWVYVSWVLVLFGAEVVASLPEWREGHEPKAGPYTAPRVRLLAAVAVLRGIKMASRSVPGVAADAVAGVPPLSAELVDQALERLDAAGYVAMTDAERWVVARDVDALTLLDLYRDLGLAITSPSDALAESAVAEDPALSEPLARLAGIEEEALARPLGAVLDDWVPPETADGDAPVGPLARLEATG